jgi:GNAT superfamily N-acetyltransferase
MTDRAVISEAMTNAERREVQTLFEGSFPDIASNAIPAVKDDHLYAPVVLRYHDSKSGRLVGAALTCRAQRAVSASLMRQGGYEAVMGKHSELDLMCVDPEFRGRGIGSELVRAMEDQLRERGVRVWFGNATKDLETERLRNFYGQHGFKVLPDGEPLPDLLGKQWQMPLTEEPAFFFYKQIKAA